MITMTDIFAGAGGSSTGAAGVPGVEVTIAANHWQLAVDVHNANHPGADHVCADIKRPWKPLDIGLCAMGHGDSP